MNPKSECINHWFGQANVLLTLRAIALVWCLNAANSSAQIYTVLWQFTGDAGNGPWGKLLLSGQTLYGTTRYGNDHGAVFKVNTDGSGYTVLHGFSGTDGSDPIGALVLSGVTLYGTTENGGISADPGTIFKINTDGSSFITLKDFASGGGRWPHGDMVLSGATLYGTTSAGGSAGLGTVFKINTDGSGYVVLHDFTGYPGDGCEPDGALLLSGKTLYGATPMGGTYGPPEFPDGLGMLFRIQTDGSGYKILKQFTRDDGWGPCGGMVLSGTTLYGITGGGYPNGNFGGGTIFKINTDGTGYTVLHKFNGSPNDGAIPYGGLVLSGTTLYGTTILGGSYGDGTIFKINTDGSGYSVVKEFTGDDGCWPYAGLVLDGGTLYGTTTSGGISNCGVVFALGKPPTIQASPPTQTAEAGGEVNLAAHAVGDPPLNYQWFFNGSAIAGCTTNCVLHLPGVQGTNAGTYMVIVSNCFGTVTSAPVTLNVIPCVDRRAVPALNLMGQTGSALNVEYADALDSPANWLPLDTVDLTAAPQLYLDVSAPLPPQRFYRVWQTGTPAAPPSLNLPFLVPAITLTGNIGDQLRLDGINQFGPTDAWVNLDTVTLTNTSQLYFDLSAPGQPRRLYRIVPVP